MLNITTSDRCFFTQPVFLIGTNNEDGSENFAPISWISFTCGEPCCLVISVGGNKQTSYNIQREEMLSATVLTPDLLAFAECCNKATQNDALYKKVKPEFERGKVLNVPLIQGATWSYECEVIKTVEFNDSHTYFAEFKSINVAQGINSLDYIDLRKINPVIYSPMHYFTVGEHLGEIGDFSKTEEC